MRGFLNVGQNTSVSRLAVISFEDHWDLFRRHVQKPPARTLERIAEINVDVLQQTARSHSGTELSVVPSPLRYEPGPCRDFAKNTRGLANAILPKPKLNLHSFSQ